MANREIRLGNLLNPLGIQKTARYSRAGSRWRRDTTMVKFRAKHVCTPGARRVKIQPWKRQVNKVKVVAVEKLPIDYVPEIKVKKRKKTVVKNHHNLTNCDISTAVAKSSQVSKGTNIPRITITCGGHQVTKARSQKMDIEYTLDHWVGVIRDVSIPISHI
jgi:hypothetical protein